MSGEGSGKNRGVAAEREAVVPSSGGGEGHEMSRAQDTVSNGGKQVARDLESVGGELRR